jgi:hypothetical protein
VDAGVGAAGDIGIEAHASLTGFGTVPTRGRALCKSAPVPRWWWDSSVIRNQILFGGPASLMPVDAKAFAGTIGSFGFWLRPSRLERAQTRKSFAVLSFRK